MGMRPWLEDPYLERIRDLVVRALSPWGAEVFLFGSRARGTARRASDVDVAVSASSALPRSVLARLREALEESAVPYRVEIVDLRDVDPPFRERVFAEGIRWTG